MKGRRLAAVVVVAATACGGPPAVALAALSAIAFVPTPSPKPSASTRRGEPAAAIQAYLGVVHAAARADGDPWQVAALQASLDALATRTMPSLGDASSELRPSRTGPHRRKPIVHELGLAEAEARGPFAKGLIARALTTLAQRRGDAAEAERQRTAGGCVRDALVTGPTTWASVTGADDPGPFGPADAAVQPAYPTGDAFGSQMHPVRASDDACAIGLSQESWRPGVRDVVVDIDIPRAETIGLVLRAHGAATLRAAGAVIARRAFELGDGEASRALRLVVGPGRLRVVARVGTAKEDDAVEIGAYGEDGSPLHAYGARRRVSRSSATARRDTRRAAKDRAGARRDAPRLRGGGRIGRRPGGPAHALERGARRGRAPRPRAGRRARARVGARPVSGDAGRALHRAAQRLRARARGVAHELGSGDRPRQVLEARRPARTSRGRPRDAARPSRAASEGPIGLAAPRRVRGADERPRAPVGRGERRARPRATHPHGHRSAHRRRGRRDLARGRRGRRGRVRPRPPDCARHPLLLRRRARRRAIVAAPPRSWRGSARSWGRRSASLAVELREALVAGDTATAARVFSAMPPADRTIAWLSRRSTRRTPRDQRSCERALTAPRLAGRAPGAAPRQWRTTRWATSTAPPSGSWPRTARTPSWRAPGRRCSSTPRALRRVGRGSRALAPLRRAAGERHDRRRAERPGPDARRVGPRHGARAAPPHPQEGRADPRAGPDSSRLAGPRRPLAARAGRRDRGDLRGLLAARGHGRPRDRHARSAAGPRRRARRLDRAPPAPRAPGVAVGARAPRQGGRAGRGRHARPDVAARRPPCAPRRGRGTADGSRRDRELHDDAVGRDRADDARDPRPRSTSTTPRSEPGPMASPGRAIRRDRSSTSS